MTSSALNSEAEVVSTSVKRLNSLTSIRFFSALLVFTYHAFSHAPFDVRMFDTGYVGVSFFFVLSGFVMSWTMRGSGAGEFYLRRFGRVYPAYFVAWVCAIVLLLAAREKPVDDLIAVTLLQSWFPSSDIYFGASAPFWSMSVEAFLYASFPLVALILAKFSMRGLAGAAAVALGMSLVVPVSLMLAGTPSSGTSALWLGYIFPPSRLGEFVLGAVIGAAYVRGFRLRLPGWLAVAVVVVALGIAPYVPVVLSYCAVTVVPFALLIATFATIDAEDRTSWLRHPVLVRLGDWSYSFYLFHAMTLAVFFQIGQRLGQDGTKNVGVFWVVVTISFFVAIAVSGFVHHRVELPMARRIRGWTTKNRARQPG